MVWLRFIVFILITSGCITIVEPVTYGNYYIENQSSDILVIKAFEQNSNTTEILLQKEIVQPGTTEKIYEAVEGSGGHVMPSNFFGHFEVYVQRMEEDSLVYSGVNNMDWEQRGSSGDTLLYYLSIPQSN